MGASGILRIFGLFPFVLLLFTACFRQDVVTVEIEIPQMRGDPCVKIVMSAFQQLEPDAIRRVQPDAETGIVLVTYDSTKLALRNIEHAIAALGFDAGPIQGNAAARKQLPDPCQ